MTNAEIQMTKEIRNPKPEREPLRPDRRLWLNALLPFLLPSSASPTIILPSPKGEDPIRWFG